MIVRVSLATQPHPRCVFPVMVRPRDPEEEKAVVAAAAAVEAGLSQDLRKKLKED